MRTYSSCVVREQFNVLNLLSISNGLVNPLAIFHYLAKLEKTPLQWFGKALAKIWQLAILWVITRIYARVVPARIRAPTSGSA